MRLGEIENIYFIGIGGIGMSALALYFNALGKNVVGYDRTATTLTGNLMKEGIDIHFIDNMDLIPVKFRESADKTLIIYTPAIPKMHSELKYFQENNYNIYKRSQVLGMLTKEFESIAVAGTHGKTTTSTMLAHIFNSSIGCNAFVGGISVNYNSNFILNKESKHVIVEADEFDRSFLTLFPKSAIITSMDADHLDIYKDKADIVNTFYEFVSQIEKDGNLVIKHGLSIPLSICKNVFTYDLENTAADFHTKNLKEKGGFYSFTLVTPDKEIKDFKLGVPGRINVENAIAACAISLIHGIEAKDLKNALTDFKGVKRRFEIKINTKEVAFIDDYAHHPEEIKAFLASIKEMYPNRKITGIFQPHLYSRTRDFAVEFAESLNVLDQLILLDIYPAREEPIPGVTADIILDKVSIENKHQISKSDLCDLVRILEVDVLVTMGAGDIDKILEPIYNILMGLHQITSPEN